MRDDRSQWEVICVFWDFIVRRRYYYYHKQDYPIDKALLYSSQGNNGPILSAGEWSEENCSRNADLSNISVSVCECNHLTHFAILLSAAPQKLSHGVIVSLEVIGYVGVSVSLVAMSITIITFLTLRQAYSDCIIF